MPDSGTGAGSLADRGASEPTPVGELVERAVRLGRLAAKRSVTNPTGPSSEALWEYEMRVPALYRKASWDRVTHNGLKSYGQKVAEHVADGRSLLILGGVGLGKSCAAALIAKAAAHADLMVGWTYVPDLVDQMLDPKNRVEAMRSQMKPDLLVWDDFGVEKLADWQVPLLDRVVERRYRQGKPMVVTGNLTSKQLFDAQDASMLRMADRWRDRGFMAVLKGESYRASA